MKRLIIGLGIFTLCSGAFAIELDKVSHFGISYAIQTGIYGINKHAFKMDKPKTVLLSFALTLAVTSIKEFAIDKKADPRDILANGMGAAAASATILVFDF